MRFKEYDVDLADADADGICASQTPAAGGEQNLTIDGALASGGSVTLDYARQIAIVSAADDSARTFTLTGTDPQGVAQTEDVTGGNATTVESAKYFKTITQVSVDDDTAGAVTVGTVDEASTQAIPINWRSESGATINVDVTGTIDFTVQETFDDIQALGFQGVQWVNITALATKTADTTSKSTVGATALRLIVNSHSSEAELQMNVVQPSAV
jgi:hypothetical protein